MKQIITKTYTICYGVFRVADEVRSQSARTRLEEYALSLFESVVAGDLREARRCIKTLGYFLQFSADTGMMNPANDEVIRQELSLLYKSIAELEKDSANMPEFDLESIFNMPLQVNPEEWGEEDDSSGKNTENGNSATEDNRQNGNKNSQTADIAERHEAILERIKQNNNCKMKDLQDGLPDVSERTLRYDIQKLADRGLVERVGNGGPATYYRIPDGA